MKRIIRGHFSRPINRAHFVELCISLANEYWGEIFNINKSCCNKNYDIQIWKTLALTNTTIGLNCHWHKDSSSHKLIDYLPELIEKAIKHQPRIEILIIALPTLLSPELIDLIDSHNLKNKHKINLNVVLWGWESIEEMLLIHQKAAVNYLSLGFAIQPEWHEGTLETESHNHLLPRRRGTGKKVSRDNQQESSNQKSAFTESTIIKFREQVYSQRFSPNTKLLKIRNHLPMGFALGFIQNNAQIELWILTPEPRDLEFTYDTARWIKYICIESVKYHFAEILLKNPQLRDSISIDLYFVPNKSTPTSSEIRLIFPDYPIKRTWSDLFPDENLRYLRYSAAEATIINDDLYFRHYSFACGCTILHAYRLPIGSVSDSLVRKIMTSRFYPKALPHSHEVFINDELIYSRSLSEFKAHQSRSIQSKTFSNIQEKLCKICGNIFFGYRQDYKCSTCEMKTGLFGGVFTYAELLRRETDRPRWDY